MRLLLDCITFSGVSLMRMILKNKQRHFTTQASSPRVRTKIKKNLVHENIEFQGLNLTVKLHR